MNLFDDKLIWESILLLCKGKKYITKVIETASYIFIVNLLKYVYDGRHFIFVDVFVNQKQIKALINRNLH